MTNISVIQHGDRLVVDSRLIAEELGVKHKNFLETIRNHQTTVEQAFGQLAFETAPVINSVGAVNIITFALLNEDQATFLMTLSRNTPQVVKAKVNLVKAFSKAKTLLEKTKTVDNPPKYLPPLKQAEKALEVAERFKACFGGFSPQIEQLHKDVIGNVLIITNRALENQLDNKPTWMGVVNFAEVELNHRVPTKGEFRRGALGKWIRFYYPHLSDRQEKRFCNETQRDIWVYPVHEVRQELTTAVNDFFNHLSPGTKLKNDGAFKRGN